MTRSELDLRSTPPRCSAAGTRAIWKSARSADGTGASSTRSSRRRRPTWWPAPGRSAEWSSPVGAQRDPQGPGQRQDPASGGHRVQSSEKQAQRSARWRAGSRGSRRSRNPGRNGACSSPSAGHHDRARWSPRSRMHCATRRLCPRVPTFAVQVDAGERIGITGAQRRGQVHVAETATGAAGARRGPRLPGASVAVGEIDQARAEFAGTARLVDRFEQQVPTRRRRTCGPCWRSSSGRRPRRTSRRRPSPGERTRAGLALLQAVGTNVLVLDEPTNHLDLPAIEQLEAALDSYDGALLVTHDRRMLANVRLIGPGWSTTAGWSSAD